MIDDTWKKLESWICSKLEELDPRVSRSPGSGNGNCKGDLKFSTNIGLHVEAKYRNIKSVFNQDWFDKCADEIPFHVDKIPILVSQNKINKKMVHLDGDDFFDIYIELWKYRNGEL